MEVKKIVMFNYKQQMDKILENDVTSGAVKGASALVLHNGEEIYFNAFGYADAEKGTPMKRDTIIRLFSMSKPITACAAMICMERGIFDLLDPVAKYLPEYADIKVWDDAKKRPVAPKTTLLVKDLLNMTSGITYPAEDTDPGKQMDAVLKDLIARREAGENVDTREYARKIATVPLVFHPGERWMYGFSADVLGAVIEAASGERFGTFLKKEIFEPLGMKDTGFFVPPEKRDRFAQAYEEVNGNLQPLDRSHLGEYYAPDAAFESGGAGMVSTLDDYARFAACLANNGTLDGVKILGRKTVAFMAQNQLKPNQLEQFNWDTVKGYGYGNLMRVLVDQTVGSLNASIGEFGWDGWTGNYVSMDRTENLVFLYFIQKCGIGGNMPSVRKMRTLTYANLD